MNIEQMQAELEALKAEQAAAEAKARQLAAVKDQAEREQMASKLELQRVLKATLDYQLRSGQIQSKLAKTVLKDADGLEIAGFLYDLLNHPVTGLDSSTKGLLRYNGSEYATASDLEFDLSQRIGKALPDGWLNRMAYARQSAESSNPAIVRRVALDAALASQPEVQAPMSLDDTIAYRVALGLDPLG